MTMYGDGDSQRLTCSSIDDYDSKLLLSEILRAWLNVTRKSFLFFIIDYCHRFVMGTDHGSRKNMLRHHPSSSP